MTFWLILAAVIVPWVAVVAIGLSILSMSKMADERAVLMFPRPCPLCHTDDVIVDADGVALCMECRCSYEVVTL
jgi:hypothetical protein